MMDSSMRLMWACRLSLTWIISHHAQDKVKAALVPRCYKAHLTCTPGPGLDPLLLIFKTPHPPNIKYSHYAVYCSIMGVFHIRLVQGLNIRGRG